MARVHAWPLDADQMADRALLLSYGGTDDEQGVERVRRLTLK